jgi:hypothetical protein
MVIIGYLDPGTGETLVVELGMLSKFLTKINPILLMSLLVGQKFTTPKEYQYHSPKQNFGVAVYMPITIGIKFLLSNLSMPLKNPARLHMQIHSTLQGNGLD